MLSGIPFRHKILRRYGIFKHGNMDDISYAHKIFMQHIKHAYPEQMPSNLIMLELGPGDSVVSALIANAVGAKKIYLADAGSYATENIEFYKKAAATLLNQYDLSVPGIEDAHSFSDMLNVLNAEYITSGLAGLKTIETDSVDFIWSHSVLEHVRKKDFSNTMSELSRILKPGGFISHSVDLQDHLDRGLNNLRFSESFWENDYVASSGFYTNRLGYTESLEIMKKAGLTILSTEAGRWDSLPLPKDKMHQDFRNIPEEELRVRTYNALLSKE